MQCPMRKRIFKGEKLKEEEFAECEKELCMWYIRGECAVALLAMAVDLLVNKNVEEK